MLKFYNRETELKMLSQISENIPQTKGQLSVLIGKRRVGKTRLLKEAFSGRSQYLYLFIGRKSEAALVDEFLELISTKFNTEFFQPSSLKDIIKFLLVQTKNTPMTLIIDEFQDIQRVNKSLFSDIQNLWDANKHESMMHLVCCGSLYNLMTKIFKGADEPLMNRHDHFFHIRPLKPSYIRAVLADHGLFNAESMLNWWCLTGGIPKYLEWLSNIPADTPLFDYVISESSPFIKEGQHRLVEDFGSEHPTYFDILSAISRGYTSRSQIQSVLNMDISVALERLEKDYNVINKLRPISSKETSRDIRFAIEDPFLKFWFQFIHRNNSTLEMENYDYVKAQIKRDFNTFSGWQLESLFKAILAESKQYNRIGGYWNTKGKNEIDIVAINDMEKKVLIAEVKRNAQKYNANLLIQKSQELIQKMKLQDYAISYQGLSLDNLEEIMNQRTE